MKLNKRENYITVLSAESNLCAKDLQRYLADAAWMTANERDHRVTKITNSFYAVVDFHAVTRFRQRAILKLNDRSIKFFGGSYITVVDTDRCVNEFKRLLTADVLDALDYEGCQIGLTDGNIVADAEDGVCKVCIHETGSPVKYLCAYGYNTIYLLTTLYEDHFVDKETFEMEVRNGFVQFVQG